MMKIRLTSFYHFVVFNGIDLIMGSYTPDEVDIKVTTDKTLYKKEAIPTMSMCTLLPLCIYRNFNSH